MGVVIFSGFPGVGKTYVGNDTGLDWVDDLDGSCIQGGSGDDWEVRYVDKVERRGQNGSVLLVLWHERVWAELCQCWILFIMVYLDERLKEEYLGRYQSRGSLAGFVYNMEVRWSDFVDSC